MAEDKAPVTGTAEPEPSVTPAPKAEPGVTPKPADQYEIHDKLIAAGLKNEAQIIDRWRDKAGERDAFEAKAGESQAAAAVRIGKLYNIAPEDATEYAKEHGLETMIDDLEEMYGKPSEKAPEKEEDAETEAEDPIEKRFKALEAEVQEMRRVKDIGDYQRDLGKALDAAGVTDEEDREDIGRLASAKIALAAENGKYIALGKAVESERDRLVARDKRRWEAREKQKEGGEPASTTASSTSTTIETGKPGEKPEASLTREEIEERKARKMLGV